MKRFFFLNRKGKKIRQRKEVQEENILIEIKIQKQQAKEKDRQIDIERRIIGKIRRKYFCNLEKKMLLTKQEKKVRLKKGIVKQRIRQFF